jgi:hypothetical protein
MEKREGSSARISHAPACRKQKEQERFRPPKAKGRRTTRQTVPMRRAVHFRMKPDVLCCRRWRKLCCERCENLMVPVPLLQEGGRVTNDPAWRCVACGNVIDALIARHRRGTQLPARHPDTVRPRVPMAVTVDSTVV